MNPTARTLAVRFGWSLRLTLLALLLLWLGTRLWAVWVATQGESLQERLRAPIAARLVEPPWTGPAANAVPWIAAAALVAETRSSSTLPFPALVDFAAPLSAARESDLRAALEVNRKALELYREAAAKPECVFSPVLPELSNPRTNLIAVLDLAQLDLWQGRLADPAKEPLARSEAIDRSLAVAGCLGSDLGAITRLTGLAIERFTYGELAGGLGEGTFDVALARLRERLSTLGDPGSYESSLRAEALAQDWSRSGQWVSLPGTGLSSTSLVDPFAVRGFSAAMTNRAILTLIDLVQRPAMPPEPPSDTELVFAWNLDDWIVGRLGRGEWMRERWLRALHDARRLALSALALRERALAERRYPAALPADLDFVSPARLTDEPLRYEILADGSARLSLPAAAAQDAVLFPNKTSRRFPWTWTLAPIR